MKNFLKYLVIIILSVGLLETLVVAKEYGKTYCSIMKRKNVDDSFFYEYKEDKYNLCCPLCVRVFSKNPEKYITKYKNFVLEIKDSKFNAEEIIVKKDDVVYLQIISKDMDYNLFIEKYKLDIIVSKESEDNEVEFIAYKKGKFKIYDKNNKQLKITLIVEK